MCVQVQRMLWLQMFVEGFGGRAMPRKSSPVAQTLSVCLQCGRPRFNPWVRKIPWDLPWRRKWQPTPVSLPGKFHGSGSLVGYRPWGRKESDTIEWLHFFMPRKRRRKFTASSLFLLQSAGRARLWRIINQKKPSLGKKMASQSEDGFQKLPCVCDSSLPWAGFYASVSGMLVFLLWLWSPHSLGIWAWGMWGPQTRPPSGRL